MADIPADHPAITVPQQVLANSPQVLGSNAVKPAVKGGAKTVPTSLPTKRNPDELMLEELFPNDKNMRNVAIKPFYENTNTLVTSLKYSLAWTNSHDLIYLNTNFYDPVDKAKKKIPRHLKPYILYHEGIHIQEFRKKGHPSSFENMINYEINAYKRTFAWVESDPGEDFFVNNNLNVHVRNDSDGASILGLDDVFLFAEEGLRQIEEIRTISNTKALIQSVPFGATIWNAVFFPVALISNPVPKNLAFDEICFLNLVAMNSIPPQKKGSKHFTIHDLYSQKPSTYYKQFGY